MNSKQLKLVEKIGSLFEHYEVTPEEAKEICDVVVGTYKLYYVLDNAGLLEDFVDFLEEEL